MMSGYSDFPAVDAEFALDWPRLQRMEPALHELAGRVARLEGAERRVRPDDHFAPAPAPRPSRLCRRRGAWSYSLVEFHEQVGWDRGIPRPAGRRPSLRPGHRYLMTGNSVVSRFDLGRQFGDPIPGVQVFRGSNGSTSSQSIRRLHWRLCGYVISRAAELSRCGRRSDVVILSGAAYIVWAEAHNLHVPRCRYRSRTALDARTGADIRDRTRARPRRLCQCSARGRQGSSDSYFPSTDFDEERKELPSGAVCPAASL